MREPCTFVPVNKRQTALNKNYTVHTMKKQHNFSIRVILALIVGLFAASLSAQDDLYYDPATDRPATVVVEETYPADQPNNVTRRYRESDEYYGDNDDDYAYQYSSRIRRFHQPVRAVEYYDPVFSDLWMYDSYYTPGASIYTYGYNDYWSWRRWNRWNRRNSFWGNNFYSPGFNSWGWGNAGFNGWAGTMVLTTVGATVGVILLLLTTISTILTGLPTAGTPIVRT